MSREDDDSPSFSQREHNYDVNSRIMLAAIFSLSFVIVLVTILHIYARCVLRRQARRQAALSRFAFITSSVDDIHSSALPPRTGLDPAVMAALPSFIFKRTNNTGISSDQIGLIECSVCLSMLEDGETARALPNCKHTFHAECINQWFGSNSTCPICRTEAPPRLVAEPREGVIGAPPSAPPVEGSSSSSDGGLVQHPAKINSIGSGSSSSRLSSFRRILNIERSSRRMQNQSCGQEEGRLPDV